MNTNKLLLTCVWLACLCQPIYAIHLIDVPSHHPAAAAVVEAIERYQLFEPYPDQTFRGEQLLTRYQLAQAGYQMVRYLRHSGKIQRNIDSQRYQAYRILLQENGGDVPSRHWALDAIQELYALGLLQSEGSQFKGSSKVSRYALAHMLQELFNWLQIKIPVPQRQIAPLLRDVPAQHWARPAVEHLVAQGILSLDANGYFQGNRPVNQYELAITLVKTLQWLEKASLFVQQNPVEPMQPEPKQERKKIQTRRDGKRLF